MQVMKKGLAGGSPGVIVKSESAVLAVGDVGEKSDVIVVDTHPANSNARDELEEGHLVKNGVVQRGKGSGASSTQQLLQQQLQQHQHHLQQLQQQHHKLQQQLQQQQQKLQQQQQQQHQQQQQGGGSKVTTTPTTNQQQQQHQQSQPQQSSKVVVASPQQQEEQKLQPAASSKQSLLSVLQVLNQPPPRQNVSTQSTGIGEVELLQEAENLMKQGKFEDVVRLCQSRPSPASHRWLQLLYAAHVRLKQFQEAEQVLLERIRVNPLDIEAYNLMGLMLLRQDGEGKRSSKQAKSCFEAVLTLSPNNPVAKAGLSACDEV